MWAVLPGSALGDAEDVSELQRGTVEVDHTHTPGPYGEDSGSSQEEANEAEPEAEISYPADKRRVSGRYFSSIDDRAEERDAAGRRANRNACFLCGDWSHHAAACQNERCIVCLRTGHHTRDCPTDRRPGVCSTCGRVGHQRRECPAPMTPTPAELADCRCVVCGGPGHLDCSPFESRPKQASRGRT